MSWSKATNNLTETAKQLWSHVQGSPAAVVRSFPMPPERVIDSGIPLDRLLPRKHYFSITINEMFICQSRQWLNQWDPMALVVTEFMYDGKLIVVPFVVGPSLIKMKLQDVPAGMALTDTRVAGLHPYQGGLFAVSVILAQVKRASYAGRVLAFLENVANVVPAGTALTPHLKVAGAIMDGIDALFGMKEDTKPLAGHRWEYDPGTTPWLKPGFFAILNTPDTNLRADKLGVIAGRLCEDAKVGAAGFRETDFLLYSLSARPDRDDYVNLPVYQSFKKALALAASGEPGNWENAKAGLVAVYQEIITGPDFTFGQAQSLIEEFKQQLVTAHAASKGFPELGQAAILEARNALATSLRLQPGESEEKLLALVGAQEFLRLR